jgi:succinyl-CoA:mesaconate CoA transferase
VLFENFRADTTERLGLSYEELRKQNPRLRYTSTRGFGDPRAAASAYAT